MDLHETVRPQNGSDAPSALGRSEPRARCLRTATTEHRQAHRHRTHGDRRRGLGVLAGFFVADDANEVQDLRDEAVSLSEDLDQDESELTKSQAAQADVEAVVADCVEASGAIAGLLAASIDEMAGAYDAFAETPITPRAAAGRRLRLRSQGIIEPPDRVPGRPVSCLAKRQPLASCDEDTLVLLQVLELGGLGWNRRTRTDDTAGDGLG